MTGFSASIPAALMAEANAHLESLGHGPANFSVPVREGDADATHAGLHCWNIPAFRQAIDAMISSGDFPGLEITEDTDGVSFAAHCQTHGLEWSDPTFWHENPVMKGDIREHGGKTWESLLDFNVWEPGISGWREVVSEGYPEWIQPTGAHDAYNIGDRVSFEGQDYESVINANTWSPTAYPAGWQAI